VQRASADPRETALKQPDVSVVVASHGRARRLSTLLDALAEQTLDPERWKLVVVHTYDEEVTARVLEDHRLSRAGTLRHTAVDLAVARPSVQRNIGWRATGAPLIAFTDDDCRPRKDWLERLVEAARAHPGAIVQGATRPDPREEKALSATHVRTLHVNPPGRFTQTCNILYERAVLERIGGFDERAITGEDIDLALRAQDAGARLVGAPGALVYHAVEALSFSEKVRSNQKWQHLAYVVKQHPRLRAHCRFRIWWKPEHLYAALALAGLVGVRRHPWMLAAVMPYYRFERWRYGNSARQRVQMARRMPERWLVEIVEIGTFVRGSVRYHTILL